MSPPKKPTQRFGYLAFLKDGRVEAHNFRLSEIKATQEEQAVKRFVELHNTSNQEFQLSNIQQLPENDHDFLVDAPTGGIQIQLTELVERSFTFPMTQDEYDSGSWVESILKASGERPLRVDIQKRDAALCDLIIKKIGKKYSTSSKTPLWLVVFSTFHYETEFYKKGRLEVSAALQITRNYLLSNPPEIFREIWYTDLLNCPIKVWPNLV